MELLTAVYTYVGWGTACFNSLLATGFVERPEICNLDEPLPWFSFALVVLVFGLLWRTIFFITIRTIFLGLTLIEVLGEASKRTAPRRSKSRHRRHDDDYDSYSD